jgi:phosphomannomutase/phosphoglucomutase
MNMESKVFRQYDIRGIVGEELTQSFAHALGKAFGTLTLRMGEKKAVIGYDNRVSSEPLKDALAAGMISTGLNVIDCGTAISPALYFSRILFQTNAGIMITASHNPPKYNGFKLCSADGNIMYGEQLQQLKKMIEKLDFIIGQGKIEKVNIRENYLQTIIDKINLGSRKLKIVIDCGNGTASFFAPTLFQKLGCQVIPIYCEADSTFPNHFPNPIKKENMNDLINIVLENKADLGIAFDGDGDRLGVVDNLGNIILGDLLMILFWREIMPKYPSSKAIVEIKCSQALVDEIKKLGGEPVFYKTGHSLIKSKMKELNAVFTGDISGHMFFADEYFGHDDALYAAARLLRILSNTDKSLSDLLSDINKYYSTPEIRVESSDNKKFNQVEIAKKYFKDKQTPMIEIDGIRALFENGWGLIRASNTEPELTIRCEADTPAALEEIKREIDTALLQ